MTQSHSDNVTEPGTPQSRMANLIKVKKATAKSWPTKLKPSLIARGEGRPYEEVTAKLIGELPELIATVTFD